MKREKGAVSVFLVIVLFTTVLLGGLFIDASRILLAKRFVRNAIDSSARSALSYYDAHLASEYGMFAVDGSTAEQAFRRYFKTHIKLKENERFDILRMNVEDGDIEVKMSGSLSTNDDGFHGGIFQISFYCQHHIRRRAENQGFLWQ